MTIGDIIKERILDKIELVDTKIFDIHRLKQQIEDDLNRLTKDDKLPGSCYLSYVGTIPPTTFNRFCRGCLIEIYITWYEKAENGLIFNKLIKNANRYTLQTYNKYWSNRRSDLQATKTEVLGVLF